MLNRCVFEKIVGATFYGNRSSTDSIQGLQKVIPDTPKGDIPVHLRDKQLFADRRRVVFPHEADVGILKERVKAIADSRTPDSNV